MKACILQIIQIMLNCWIYVYCTLWYIDHDKCVFVNNGVCCLLLSLNNTNCQKSIGVGSSSNVSLGSLSIRLEILPIENREKLSL